MWCYRSYFNSIIIIIASLIFLFCLCISEVSLFVFLSLLVIVSVTMQAQKEAPPDMQCKDKFLLQSVKVNEGTAPKDITAEMVITKLHFYFWLKAFHNFELLFDAINLRKLAWCSSLRRQGMWLRSANWEWSTFLRLNRPHRWQKDRRKDPRREVMFRRMEIPMVLSLLQWVLHLIDFMDKLIFLLEERCWGVLFFYLCP